jgi:hypothetical protein
MHGIDDTHHAACIAYNFMSHNTQYLAAVVYFVCPCSAQGEICQQNHAFSLYRYTVSIYSMHAATPRKQIFRIGCPAALGNVYCMWTVRCNM